MYLYVLVEVSAFLGGVTCDEMTQWGRKKPETRSSKKIQTSKRETPKERLVSGFDFSRFGF
jgi:hypothetical protein